MNFCQLQNSLLFGELVLDNYSADLSPEQVIDCLTKQGGSKFYLGSMSGRDTIHTYNAIAELMRHMKEFEVADLADSRIYSVERAIGVLRADLPAHFEACICEVEKRYYGAIESSHVRKPSKSDIFHDGRLANLGNGPIPNDEIDDVLATIQLSPTVLSSRTSASIERAEEVSVIIVGKEGWTPEEFNFAIECRRGKTLKVYSQELFLCWAKHLVDPYCFPYRLPFLSPGHPALAACRTLAPVLP